jgi:hypothetical protein
VVSPSHARHPPLTSPLGLPATRRVQPNPDTQRKQTELWKSLILGCVESARRRMAFFTRRHAHSDRAFSQITARRRSPFLFVPRLAYVPRARRWCHHHRSFSLRLDDDAHPLWRNDAIDRRLPPDARRLFVDALVLDGAAAWLDGDPGPKSKCLVFWRSQDAWCDELCLWAAQSGLEGQIVTLHEVAGGANTGGPPALEGAPFEFLANVAARLEQRDKGAFVPERGEDDAGIKFF